MHISVKNLTYIENKIKKVTNNFPTIIAVSKNFGEENIIPLLSFGHKHFGENKVQECAKKWNELKYKYENIKLHMIGKLQTNKVKECMKHFDFIHSLDSKKLAKKIYEEEIKQNKKIKIFIQVNIGQENQKSGVNISELEELLLYCYSLKLDIIGLMCIPPIDNTSKFFSKMLELNNLLNLSDLSMGMSSDYLEALNFKATFVRIGSLIFGERI